MILIVDDEFGARSALQAILEGAHSVEAFSRGSAALAYIEANPDLVDAVFVDFTMPEMDGRTVCDAIRHIDANISIIGVTGNVAADFGHTLFAYIEKRGAAVAQIRDAATGAIEATRTQRSLSGRFDARGTFSDNDDGSFR